MESHAHDSTSPIIKCLARLARPRPASCARGTAISCSRADSATSAWLGLTGQVRVGRRRRLGRWTRACQVAARLQSKGALVAAPA